MRVDYKVMVDEEHGYAIYREHDGRFIGFARTPAAVRLKIAQVEQINLDEVMATPTSQFGLALRFFVGSDHPDDPTGARPW